jgi:hypothetical protein
MPLWAWIAVGLGAVLLVALVLAIWAYPRDNSF